MPHLGMKKIKKGLYPLTTRETDILQRLSKASMENSRLNLCFPRDYLIHYIQERLYATFYHQQSV